ncbi:MAG: ribosome maturation factor RimP [Clostridia bacterium]|nr:ribosome maturation factor RimP [Deltaproteobacteria bacterium]
MSELLVQKVEAAILPVLARDGYEVVLIEFLPRAKTMRLYIDREPSDREPGAAPKLVDEELSSAGTATFAGSNPGSVVTLEDCQRVSRLVSDILDGEGFADGIDGRFTLEVSSPGLDRPLVKPKDFQRFVGRKVQLTTREMLDGRRKFAGALTQADEASVHLEVDGKPWVFAYDVIDRARLVPEF